MSLTVFEPPAQPPQNGKSDDLGSDPSRAASRAVPIQRRLATTDLLIVDPLDLSRAGLGHLLDPHPEIRVVGATGSGDEAVRMATELQPHVVLLSVDLLDRSGAGCIQAIVAACPSVRVLALMTSVEPDCLEEALQAGACGYLTKATAGQEVAEAIRAAVEGRAQVAPAASPRLDAWRQTSEGEKLTDREIEVLSLLARGSSNKAMAKTLRISEATVKTHLTRIFASLKVADRTQAALWAYRNGLAGR